MRFFLFPSAVDTGRFQLFKDRGAGGFCSADFRSALHGRPVVDVQLGIEFSNRNKEVHIYRYVTESTFDAYLWQTVENKQKFISQIMTSKSPVRSCEDIDEAALSYAEIKALCAGDERIREKMDLDVDVVRLRLMKANHQSQQYRLEDNILRHFPAQSEENRGFLSGFEADMKTLEQHPHPKDGFAGMEVKGDLLTDKDTRARRCWRRSRTQRAWSPFPSGATGALPCP